MRNVPAVVDLGRFQITQHPNTESSRRILRLSSAQIVFATGKLALPARVRDDQRQRRRKRNGANLFGATIEEHGVLRATEQRNHLVEQAGLNTDVTMLRTLARLCDFETRHLEREELQQEQRRR